MTDRIMNRQTPPTAADSKEEHQVLNRQERLPVLAQASDGKQVKQLRTDFYEYVADYNDRPWLFARQPEKWGGSVQGWLEWHFQNGWGVMSPR